MLLMGSHALRKKCSTILGNLLAPVTALVMPLFLNDTNKCLMYLV